jgi:hypothetical protein
LWSAPQPAHCENSADGNVKKRIGYGSAHHSASSHTSGDRATGSSNCEQSLAHGCLLHISVESPRPPKISLPNLNNSGRPLGHQEAFAYLNLTNASLLSAGLKRVAPAPKAMTITTSSVVADSSSGAFLRPPHRLWGTPWMWTLAYGHRQDRTPTHGYEATREAAMAAFAKSSRRE